jgi:hypothetical protein
MNKEVLGIFDSMGKYCPASGIEVKSQGRLEIDLGYVENCQPHD